MIVFLTGTTLQEPIEVNLNWTVHGPRIAGLPQLLADRPVVGAHFALVIQN